MDISIIIVNYNVREYIISCIQSIYKHSKSNISFEIIIVDNNSKDGSVTKLKEKFPKTFILKNSKNIGFSKAVNQGSKKARGKYLFILNPDTLFIEDSLNYLLKIARSSKNFGVVGPALISKNRIIQQSYWRNPTIKNTFLSLAHLDFLNFKKNYYNIEKNRVSKVDTISGGAFFLKSEIFKKFNGFNENLFWMEDVDFCYRIKKMNYSTYYFPLTKIVHYGGKSAEKNYNIAITNQLISKIKYFNIHHNKFSAFLIALIILFISLIKLFVLTLLIPFSKTYRKKILAYQSTIRLIISFRNGI